jgi:hypothetical protein
LLHNFARQRLCQRAVNRDSPDERPILAPRGQDSDQYEHSFCNSWTPGALPIGRRSLCERDSGSTSPHRGARLLLTARQAQSGADPQHRGGRQRPERCKSGHCERSVDPVEYSPAVYLLRRILSSLTITVGAFGRRFWKSRNMMSRTTRSAGALLVCALLAVMMSRKSSVPQLGIAVSRTLTADSAVPPKHGRTSRNLANTRSIEHLSADPVPSDNQLPAVNTEQS